MSARADAAAVLRAVAKRIEDSDAQVTGSLEIVEPRKLTKERIAEAARRPWRNQRIDAEPRVTKVSINV